MVILVLEAFCCALLLTQPHRQKVIMINDDNKSLKQPILFLYIRFLFQMNSFPIPNNESNLIITLFFSTGKIWLKRLT